MLTEGDGDGLTIRNLLDQTSGIPNPIPLGWAHLIQDDSPFDEKERLSEIISENSKLDFKPGAKYAYSNLSYWLLGEIIGKVSGISYKDYMRTKIFQRLSLSSAEMDFIVEPRSDHANGYLKQWSIMDLLKSLLIEKKYFGEYENGWLHINEHYLDGPAFGGIVASAKSVGSFLQDQLKEHSVLFSDETKTLFYEQQKNSSGNPIPMTLGWHIGSVDGSRFYYKEGGGAGFHSEMRLYPSSKIATVFIANSTDFDADGFLNSFDKDFLR